MDVVFEYVVVYGVVVDDGVFGYDGVECLFFVVFGFVYEFGGW